MATKSKEQVIDEVVKENLPICPVLSVAASINKKNTGAYCLKEQCAWWSKACKCCYITFI